MQIKKVKPIQLIAKTVRVARTQIPARPPAVMHVKNAPLEPMHKMQPIPIQQPASHAPVENTPHLMANATTLV
jgi:hypothetical protein